MKTIITYGTFDLFHVGHVRLLKRLRQLGDRLVVGVSSDEFNMEKGKESFFSYAERAEIVASCKYVDQVFPEYDWEQKRNDIKKYNASIFAIGDDWKGQFDDLKSLCEVVYLPRTKNISTTSIKENLSKYSSKDIDSLEQKLHDIMEIVRTLTKQQGS